MGAGIVFNDRNNNNTIDTNEPILRNLKVAIYNSDGNSINDTETDENGNFRFENAPADTTRVSVVRDIHAFNPTISFSNLSLPPSTSPINISSIITEGDVINGEVFNDHNNNADRDDNELQLRNHRIAIFDTNGISIVEAETDAGGAFEFPSVPAASDNIQLLGNWLNIIPASMNGSSNLDLGQANLKYLISDDILGDNINASNVYYELFFKPWIHPAKISNPQDIFIRMIENAHSISIDLYELVRNTFIQHNILLPTIDVTVNSQAYSATAQLVDALGNHISGIFDVVVVIIDEDPPVNEIRRESNANGSIQFSISTYSRYTVEFNIQELTDTQHAFWIRA